VFGPIIGALIQSATTSFLSQALASFAISALLCVAIGFMDVFVQTCFTPSEFLFPTPENDSWIGSLQARLIIIVILSGCIFLEAVRMPLEASDGAMVELSCEDELQNKEIQDRVTDLVSGWSLFLFV